MPDIHTRNADSTNAGSEPIQSVPQTVAARGLAGMFGLDARAALLTIAIDLLVFGVDTFSAEMLLPLGIAIAAGLGVIVYRMQRRWYGDDRDAALIKAMVVALLTAIPVPITPLFSIPGGLLGLVGQLRRRQVGSDASTEVR
jgi:hypothetical protein